MNRQTFNNLRTNTNASDLFGRRQNGLSTINNLADLNVLLAGDDLPMIEVYDGVNDVNMWRFDVLYGVKTIDPRLSTRLSGAS